MAGIRDQIVKHTNVIQDLVEAILPNVDIVLPELLQKVMMEELYEILGEAKGKLELMAANVNKAVDVTRYFDQRLRMYESNVDADSDGS